MQERLAFCVCLLHPAHVFRGFLPLYPHRRLHPLHGRMFTNAHLIKSTGDAALFPYTAMANHSCRPNSG
jgi:hypothetical protein